MVILLTGKYHDRIASSFAVWNASLWCFVCTSMYMSVYPPAAISGELALAFTSIWGIYKIRIDATMEAFR